MKRFFCFYCLCAALGFFPATGSAADRLVVIGGDLTEIVYALGAGDRVVATDTTSSVPAAAAELPKVGYMRALAAEGVLAMRPDLIIASEKSGPPAVVKQLKASGAGYVEIPDTPTLRGFAEKTRAIAAAIDRSGAAENLITETLGALQTLRAAIAKDTTKPKVMLVFSTGRGALMAAGRSTTADRLIRLAGGENVFSGFESFKPVSTEAVLAARPEILVSMPRVIETIGGAEALFSKPEFQAIPAGKDRRLIVLEGAYLLGLGPRTPEAVRVLIDGFYPGRL